jgi:PHD/YefM family antitoxin component YafN of YafNO toxin-antitoxin module
LAATEVAHTSLASGRLKCPRYQDVALTQPVVVTRNGRDRTVMISAEEYRRLKQRDRQVFATADTPEEIVEAVRHSKMDPRHNHLDDLIKDWTP